MPHWHLDLLTHRRVLRQSLAMNLGLLDVVLGDFADQGSAQRHIGSWRVRRLTRRDHNIGTLGLAAAAESVASKEEPQKCRPRQAPFCHAMEVVVVVVVVVVVILLAGGVFIAGREGDLG